MSQWENLPQPLPERSGGPVVPAWSGFTADPRQPANQVLRASDADRDFAARLIDQARLEGRLDAAEQAGRASQALQARTLGDLAPLVSDLMVANAAPAAATPQVRQGVRTAVMGWAGLALLFNAIWLMTVLTTGHLLYYWPMWPMFGTGIPVLMALAFGASRNAEWDAQRSAYRNARHQYRDERHALRHQRRALRHGVVPPQLPPPPPPEQDLR